MYNVIGRYYTSSIAQLVVGRVQIIIE